ncbi:PD-(D/E)XK nuclease family protein [Lederbergia sp. NSJ-179]|uniref:ATP-dependent DNA helicase n=1 Tax=Lederbergia sp. NSJ-179 TaxID=2931402 RepID=UPI001FD5D5BF|nr:ATP-dependent DNA helicase [Lederbergia sp. NSJ-179]MCJ7842522.1 PD-(D/E)XK nuclease family protein [Lederbergia sp. NSJ-179]
MTQIIKIAVRTLVEYAFRSGSIETGFRTASSLHEGTKIHQKIQKTYRETDQKEVYLKTEVPLNDLTFQIDGRCDGLLMDEDGVITIDEIKSTSMPLEQITEGTYPVHWAQAILYAYIYAKDHDRSEINIQLTYVQVRTEEEKRFQRVMTREDLEAFVLDVVSRYASFARLRMELQKKRNESTKALTFPFDHYRQGQRKLAGSVYKTIQEKKTLFAKASTGIGKTISTIFPAVKAIGEGHVERIFYLTAKTITRTAAEEAFRLLQEKGLELVVVTITAKEKICFQEKVKCDKAECPFADGFYDRINGAVSDILGHEKMLTRPVIEQYARKHRICPFEFSLDLAYAADAVICDYNYMFDPRVSLQRLFEEEKKKTVLLIDEAHNLVDRAREMYSATVVKSHFLELYRMYKGENNGIAKTAKKVNDHLLEKKKQNQMLEKKLDEKLVQAVEAFAFKAEEELVRGEEAEELLLEAYFEAQAFVKIARLYDQRFTSYLIVNGNEVELKLFCLDPSAQLEQMGKGFRSKIFFSATLTPAGYYMNLLGGKEDDYVLSIPSPFDREHVEVMIQPLSTRYRDRDRTLEPIVQFIIDILQKKAGNFLVFFPSYQYMRTVYERFITMAPDVRTIVQDVGMTEEQREGFLEAFGENGNPVDRLVGFAVLGGIFSEGIDLKGERLQGVIIVGVGLPQIGLERNIIKDYFQSIGHNGYDYSYVYPGMNKVLQAGGRLIRTESDQGIIALIDDRFLQPKYQALLPFEWQHFKVVRLQPYDVKLS